jgi:adenylate kinase
MSADLSEISTESLVHEIQRRLECLNKPEKHLILIGALQSNAACRVAVH